MGRNQKTFVEHVVSGIAFVPGADSMGKRTAEEFTDGTLQTQADRRLVLTFRYFRQMDQQIERCLLDSSSVLLLFVLCASLLILFFR